MPGTRSIRLQRPMANPMNSVPILASLRYCRPGFAAALLAISLPFAALADEPVETVTVNASALVGVWKFRWPHSVGITFFHGAIFGPMRDQYCRIEPVKNDLAVHCFAGSLVKDGMVNLEGEKIHLAWGTMMLRIAMDGVLQSGSSFAGTFDLKLSGISHVGPEPSGGTKFVIAAQSEDKGGKAVLLRTILEGGMTAVPHDDAALKQNRSEPVPQLGAVEAVTYLGQGPQFGAQGEPDFLSVYAVEFAGGERICGLHQRGDGTLDAFLCL